MKAALTAFQPRSSNRVSGFIDKVTLERISGWAIVNRGEQPAQIGVLLCGQRIAIAEATLSRPDVRAAGYAIDQCGFEIEVDLSPKDLFAGNVRLVVLLPHGENVPLQLASGAAGWGIGFVDSSGLPIAERWKSLSARLSANTDLLPIGNGETSKVGNVLIEGPVKGDYSLSIVNRNFASSMLKRSEALSICSDDKNIDDDQFFNSESDLVERYIFNADSQEYDLHTLNTWPPFTAHMQAKTNTLHCYGWEESSFPQNFLTGFNEKLDLVCVLSNFTKTALENSGLTVPTVVVGSGVDPELFRLKPRKRSVHERFRFLHISSCFPRKAVDKLIEAFITEFEDDHVELYIKTFDNPHNNIRELVNSYGDRARNIILNFSNLPTKKIYELYTSSDCLVAASRGEGFLLPAAEAMAVGVPVITTDSGGQSDFCDNTTSWLVKSSAVGSSTHMGLSSSYWYEPDLNSLRKQMRAVYNASPSEINAKTDVARKLVLNTYSWEKVADRYVKAVGNIGVSKKSRYRLALVTTWNQSCGIATYSEELHFRISNDFDVTILSEIVSEKTGEDQRFVKRVWSRRRESMKVLADEIIDGQFDAVLIQHHPGHYSWPDLAVLIDCIVQGCGGKIKVFCQLHSTTGQRPAILRERLSLARADGFLVHTIADVENMGPIAGDTRIAIIPHGVPSVPENLVGKVDKANEFHIGSFGFCMPHKGIKDHVRSLAIAREKIPGLRATLLHAVNDDEKTIRYASEVIKLISELGLSKMIDIDFRFLSKESILKKLQNCDLIVLPYERNNESASGAIRDVMGLSVPILASDIATFADLSDSIFKCKSNHPFELARSVIEMYNNPVYRMSKLSKQRQYVEGHSWDTVSKRISNIINSTL